MVSSLRQRELGRLLRCGWIKQALFIGPLPLCSALISGCVWDCNLKCLRDLLIPQRREPLRPHTGSFQPPQRRTRTETDMLSVQALFMTSSSHSVCICIDLNSLKKEFLFLTLDLFLSFSPWCLRIKFFLYLTQLSFQPPAFSFFLSLRSFWKQSPAPAPCFPVVLALECLPSKGDFYLLSGRERRPSLQSDTDKRVKLRLNQFPESLFSSLHSGCRVDI